MPTSIINSQNSVGLIIPAKIDTTLIFLEKLFIAHPHSLESGECYLRVIEF